MTDDTSAAPERLDVDRLAQIIRTVDGSNTLGAGELAERILALLDTPAPTKPAGPAGDALREALEWYAEQARLCRLIHSEGNTGRHALQEDGGKRARAALAAAPAPQPDNYDDLVDEIAGKLPWHLDRSDAVRVADALLARGLRLPGGDETMTNAAHDVLAERQRQISVEGWTPEDDDLYNDIAGGGDLAHAAACYAVHAAEDGSASDPAPRMWPWDEGWWKPSTPRRDLVKAGALILAEIERLDRVAIRVLDDAEGEA